MMRIIQMGMGGMGNTWLNQLKPLDFVEFVGFVELSAEVAAEQAKKYDLDPKVVFTSLPEALDVIEADGVISIIPPEFRTETLKTCIEAGVGLMAEKPLAESMADAQMQVDLANQSDIVYMITQDYRYRPDLYAVKRILDSGELGKIDSVHVAHYWGFEFTGFRAEMPFPLMNDMAIHHFDLLRYFLGSNPLTIYGQSWSPSWNKNTGKMGGNALFTFPDDIHVAYTANWVTNGLRSTFEGNWRFDCELGTLTLKDNQIEIQKRDGLEGILYTYHEKEERPSVDGELVRQQYLMHEFHEAVLHGKPAATRVQDNFYSLQMVFDVIESSQTGKLIERGG